MTLHRKIALAVFVLAVAIALWLAGQPSSPPDASMSVLSYSNRRGFLVAQVLVTNTGRSVVSYGAWGSTPYGWIEAETGTGSTNLDMAPNFTGSTIVLHPRRTQFFSLYMPSDTVRWRCGFTIRTATGRERVAFRLIRIGVDRAVRPVREALIWLLDCLLPNNRHRMPERELESEWFNVTFAVDELPATSGAGVPRVLATI